MGIQFKNLNEVRNAASKVEVSNYLSSEEAIYKALEEGARSLVDLLKKEVEDVDINLLSSITQNFFADAALYEQSTGEMVLEEIILNPTTSKEVDYLILEKMDIVDLDTLNEVKSVVGRIHHCLNIENEGIVKILENIAKDFPKK